MLAALIEDLVHSRNRAALGAVEVAREAEPAPELLAALRRIAWAGLRRSGPRGRFEPELADAVAFVGWSPETHKTVKVLAARALRELSPEGDPPSPGTAQRPVAPVTEVEPPVPVETCAVCSRSRPVAQSHSLYSARIFPCAPGEAPDYRELRLHACAVCAACAGRVRRHSGLALAGMALAAILAFLLRHSTPLLLALAASAGLCLLWLLAERKSGLRARLERKAVQERRTQAVPGGRPGFGILREQAMVWPFTRPATPGARLEAGCQVCGQRVTYSEGYLLSASQVVTEPRYWEFGFLHEWNRYRDFGPRSPELTALAHRQAGQNAAWLVCETCIGLFKANRENARFECRTWWERGQAYRRGKADPGLSHAALQAARSGWESAFGSAPPPAAPPEAAGPPGATE